MEAQACSSRRLVTRAELIAIFGEKKAEVIWQKVEAGEMETVYDEELQEKRILVQMPAAAD